MCSPIVVSKLKFLYLSIPKDSSGNPSKSNDFILSPTTKSSIGSISPSANSIGVSGKKQVIALLLYVSSI